MAASFIVGLNYRFGSYSPDVSPGMAYVAVQALADLAPVCRSWLNGSRQELDGAPLTDSSDNQVEAIAWDGIGGGRSCPEGQAAVGLAFGYSNNAFRDHFETAALLCEKLWVNLPPQSPLSTFVISGEGATGKEEFATVTGKDRSAGRLPILANKGKKAFAPPYPDGQRYGFCNVAGNYETCRQVAADAFCRKQGSFASAELFGPAEPVGNAVSATNPTDTCSGSCLALTTVLCRM